MPVCTWCAVGVRRDATEPSLRNRMPFTPLADTSRNGESIVETALTSFVVGLTAQFIFILYELVTQGDSNLKTSFLLSSLLGLLVGTCAFLAMRFYDHVQASRCIRCGLHVH